MMITSTTTCSKCGTDKTYVQNNSEKWYHDKDTKEKMCKNCYSKKRRMKPTIDLTKVKKSEIKIDNSSTTKGKWSFAPKPKIKKLTKDQREIIKQRNSMPFIENISFAKFGSQGFFSHFSARLNREEVVEFSENIIIVFHSYFILEEFA